MMYLSPKIVVIWANSAVPDEMQPSQLGHHSLSEYLFSGIQNEKGYGHSLNRHIHLVGLDAFNTA